MAQTKHQILALLAEARSHPRHRFGQNFMIDQNLVRLVADAGMIEKGDLVIEVGPGTGTLTEELLERGADVLAVEIDRDLSRLLRDKYSATGNFKLIEGDALAGKHALNSELEGAIKAAHGTLPPSPSPCTQGEGGGEGSSRNGKNPHPSPLPEYMERGQEGNGSEHRQIIRLVSNLPYNIASPLVIELLIAGVDFLAFTVQKEVAERLAATAESGDYSPLSIMAQMLGDVEILRTLGRKAFWPAPKVESSLVRLIRRDRLGRDARDFGVFVQQIFSSRRKTMRNALGKVCEDADQALASAEISPTARPQEIDATAILKLFQVVKNKVTG